MTTLLLSKQFCAEKCSHQALPLSAFKKNPSTKTGYNKVCSSCTEAKKQQYIDAHAAMTASETSAKYPLLCSAW